MKATTAILSLLVLSTVASAQNPDPNKWMCRNLADSGNFTYQGESIFGTVACRPIAQAAPKTQEVATTAAPAPAAQPQPVSATAQPTAPAPATSSDQSQATIYFYRPRRFQGSALKPSVFVDDARVG